MARRRRDTRNIPYRSDTSVKIETLAHGNIKRTKTAADRRGQWAFEGNDEFLDCLESIGRQIFAVFLVSRFTGVDIEPHDLPFAAESLRNRGVKHLPRGFHDVATDAIPFDHGNDRVVGDDQLAILYSDLAPLRGCYLVISHVVSSNTNSREPSDAPCR